MNPTARPSDFGRLKPDVQLSHVKVLRLLEELRMSCRCEMAGHDFIIVVSKGLSSPKYWLEMYEPILASN